MKILYLGYYNNPVHLFLQTKGEVTYTEEKISFDVDEFDWIFSYGYSHIIKPYIINKAKNPIINLHISYLPYNRGADPNLWSWIEQTPKGVTIHKIDEGIDTGDILIQKKIDFRKNETLSSSYALLRNEIENLFIENFDDIINNNLIPKKQLEKGTFHLSKDKNNFMYLLSEGWNTPVSFLEEYGGETEMSNQYWQI
jgi:methionyl-tRNA formyltransferase